MYTSGKGRSFSIVIFLTWFFFREVTQRFPSLLQLDFQPVNQSNGGAFLSGPGMGNDGALPFPIKASFFDQDNSRQAAQDLLSK